MDLFFDRLAPSPQGGPWLDLAGIMMTTARLAAMVCLLTLLAPALAQADKPKVEALVRQFSIATARVDGLDEAHRTAQAIVDLGISRRRPELQARGYARLAYTELHFGRWDSRWEGWLQQAFDLAQDQEGLAYGEALAYRGFITGMWQHDFEAALTDLNGAIWIGRHLAHDRLLAEAFRMSSCMHKFLDQQTKAWDYAYRSLHYANVTGEAILQFEAIEQVLVCYHVFGDIGEALSYAEELHRLEMELETGSRMDEIARMASDPKALKQRTRKTIRVAREKAENSAQDRRILADSLYDYAELTALEGDYEGAIQSIQEANQLFDVLGDKSSYINSLAILQAYQIAIGELDAAGQLAAEIESAYPSIRHNYGAAELAQIMVKNSIALGSSEAALRWRARQEALEEVVMSDLRKLAEESARVFWTNEGRLRTQRALIAEGQRKLDLLWSAVAIMPLLAIAFFTAYRARSLAATKVMLQRKVDEQVRSLHEAKRVAEQASQAKSEFLARFNHELRNPLNVILGVSQLLGQQSTHRRGNESIQEDIEALQVSTQHLQSLVSDVLDVSSIEAGKTELRVRPFRLRELAESVRNLIVQGYLEEKPQVRLEVVVDASVPDQLQADDTKLRQILINVVGNAAKCTEQGLVSVHFEATPVRHARCDLRVQVADTGPGVAEPYIDTIFEPFVGDTSMKGSGLGLYIGRSLARLMGGDLTLLKSEAEGAIFELNIPVMVTPLLRHDDEESDWPKAPHRAQQTTASDRDPKRQRDVLVVDDSPLNRRIVSKLLETAESVKVRSASNLAETLVELERQLPDMVFLDLRMPDHDGFEVARTIRARYTDPSPVIVAVTGDATEEVRQRALACGFDDFLAKPFRLAEMNQLIEKHLPRSATWGTSEPTALDSTKRTV